MSMSYTSKLQSLPRKASICYALETGSPQTDPLVTMTDDKFIGCHD